MSYAKSQDTKSIYKVQYYFYVLTMINLKIKIGKQFHLYMYGKEIERTQDGAVRTTQDWSSLWVCGEVSRSCISRLIFVAQGTGRFPSIGEMLDAWQCLCLAKPAAGMVAAGPAHHSPQGALVRVPCWTGNLKLERAGLETERDLDSRPAQGIAGTDRLGYPMGWTKPRFQTIPSRRSETLCGGGASTTTEATRPNWDTRPLLTQPALLRQPAPTEIHAHCWHSQPLPRQPSLLRYTPTADAACRCWGNTLQLRDSAAGCGGDHSRACRNRANHTTAGRSFSSQTVASLPSSWAGHLIEHPKIKPKPLNTENLRKKKRVF